MTKDQELEMKKIVWAYMIQEGVVTEDSWSAWNVYGGHYNYLSLPGQEYSNYDKAKKYWDNLLHNSIHKVGIDWDKTQMPRPSEKSEFNGTFVDNSRVETLIGELRFKDGSELTLGVGHAEQRFAGYAQALAALMADKERVKKVFGE